ncbi:MAG: twin-arginine translocation signal domain-containing protein [Thermodesulfobacteriota bacterium]
MDKRDEKRAAEIDAGSVKNRMERHSSRRGFLKKALLSTVAVAGTATLAKKASNLIPKPDYKEAALRESMAGDKALRGREYVVMSSSEKRAYLDTLLENSRKGS